MWRWYAYGFCFLFSYEIFWDCLIIESEKTMAPHSSTFAWKIPWTEEPRRLQSMGSLRVGHEWATSLHFSLSCIGEGNDNPLQCSWLENPRDGRSWWAAVYGVAQSWTWLKRLSSSSIKEYILYFLISSINPAVVLCWPVNRYWLISMWISHKYTYVPYHHSIFPSFPTLKNNT